LLYERIDKVGLIGMTGLELERKLLHHQNEEEEPDLSGPKTREAVQEMVGLVNEKCSLRQLTACTHMLSAFLQDHQLISLSGSWDR
jgi:hypothetical protein